MKKAIIFDLDGTLLNSLIDIADSVNYVLKKYNMPTHKFEDYKYMIGNGVETLVKKALPSNISEQDFSKYYSEISDVYRKNQMNKTHPYNGIVDLLKTLNNRNISVNILSNKPDNFTKEVVSHYFNNINFDIIRGAKQGVPKKPAPDAVFDIISSLKLNKEDFLYVGDTSTDMQTAKNAELTSVGVLWGYRTEKELKDNGADYIISKPEEILKILDTYTNSSAKRDITLHNPNYSPL